jgi:hypothetical protein
MSLDLLVPTRMSTRRKTTFKCAVCNTIEWGDPIARATSYLLLGTDRSLERYRTSVVFICHLRRTHAIFPCRRIVARRRVSNRRIFGSLHLCRHHGGDVNGLSGNQLNI